MRWYYITYLKNLGYGIRFKFFYELGLSEEGTTLNDELHMTDLEFLMIRWHRWDSVYLAPVSTVEITLPLDEWLNGL